MGLVYEAQDPKPMEVLLRFFLTPFPLIATYYLSMPVYEKLQHIEISVVVETSKIRVKASFLTKATSVVRAVGFEPTAYQCSGF